MGYNIVVVGATGQIGAQVIKELEERTFPVKKLLVFASEKSVGESVAFGGEEIPVQALDESAYIGADIVFFCVPAQVVTDQLAKAETEGAFCIDLSGTAGCESAPFVVPELTSTKLLKSLKIVVNPPVAAIQAALILAPIQAKFGVVDATFTALQSSSALGAVGVDVLRKQSGALLNGRPVDDRGMSTAAPIQLAYNVTPVSAGGADYPNVDSICSALHQLLAEPEIFFSAELIQAPVFYSSGLSLTCKVGAQVDSEAVNICLSSQDGLEVVSSTLVCELGTSAAPQYTKIPVTVTRVANKNCVTLWSIIDNLRKGSALNAVQIAEMFIA